MTILLSDDETAPRARSVYIPSGCDQQGRRVTGTRRVVPIRPSVVPSVPLDDRTRERIIRAVFGLLGMAVGGLIAAWVLL